VSPFGADEGSGRTLTFFLSSDRGVYSSSALELLSRRLVVPRGGVRRFFPFISHGLSNTRCSPLASFSI
jgi:hypothetical protein